MRSHRGSCPIVQCERGRRRCRYFSYNTRERYLAMSVPVGQSREHPLHAMHRSRASATSGEFHPCTKVPLTISWSTFARPRVESFSRPDAWWDGHITPPAPELSAMHLPTPVHWCTAAAKSGWLRVSGEVRAWCTRMFSSTGCGSTSTPGFMMLCGSKMCLIPANRSNASGEYIVGSRAERARPSPCSPDIEPP